MRQRLGLVMLGLLLVAVLLEVMLRAGGWLYLYAQERRNRDSLRRPGAHRILCLGESTTAMGGADSFPSQLDHVLNWGPTHRFSVINKGVPAVTTDRILAEVPALLDEYDPDIVVAMMGINDDVLNRTVGEPSPWDPRPLLTSLRVYKLARFAWTQAATWAAPPASEDDEIMRAESEVRSHPHRAGAYVGLARAYRRQHAPAATAIAIEEALRLDPDHVDALIERAGVEAERGDVALAEQMFREIADGDPTRRDAEDQLVALYLFGKRFAESRAVLERRIGRGHADEQTYRMLQMSLSGLASEHVRAGRFDEAEEALRATARLPLPASAASGLGHLALLRQARGDRDGFERLLRESSAARAAEAAPRTRRNYRALKRLLCERGVLLVAVQYPLRSLATLEELLDHDPDVVYVDNQAIFQRVLRRAPYGEFFYDEFGGDFGHATVNGNRLLAQNVAHAILMRALPALGTRCPRPGTVQARGR